MSGRTVGLLAISVALATLVGLPRAASEESSSSNIVEQAQAAADELSRADSQGDARADALLEDAITQWEKALETYPCSVESHTRIAYLLSRMIGRAWQRGVSTTSPDLKPVWRRVAFHRRRMLELTAGQPSPPMTAMEVAYSYQMAGDYAQARRFYLQAGEPMALFCFYVGEGRAAEAEDVFRSMSGFATRYRAATYALHGAKLQLAIRCSELMLRDGYDAHRRAAIYRILAQANDRLGRRKALFDCARKAVALNPKSPWGWHWLAKAYSQSGSRASEAAVRTHQLTLLTSDTESDRRARGQSRSTLGNLLRLEFRRPRAAIQYYREAIADFTGLPLDWYICEGLYMNIIWTFAQDLHDPARAQAVIAEARSGFPSFPNELDRNHIRKLGLDPFPPEEGARPDGSAQPSSGARAPH